MDTFHLRSALHRSNIPVDHLTLLTKKQLAATLGVSTRTIDAWVSGKRIGCLKLSPRMLRFSLADTLTALRKYEVAARK